MAGRLLTCQIAVTIESTYQTLTKMVKNHKLLLNRLLRTWRRYYLINLRESHLCKARQKKESLIAVGDVVLKDNVTKRQFWKLGVVTEELLPGHNGNVRAAMIRISGDRKSLLRCSIKHLIPIEV